MKILLEIIFLDLTKLQDIILIRIMDQKELFIHSNIQFDIFN